MTAEDPGGTLLAALSSLHALGYEGEVEDAVPVMAFHRAECTLCDWRSEEAEDLDWKAAERAAIEHYEEEHNEDEDDDQEIT